MVRIVALAGREVIHNVYPLLLTIQQGSVPNPGIVSKPDVSGFGRSNFSGDSDLQGMGGGYGESHLLAHNPVAVKTDST